MTWGCTIKMLACSAGLLAALACSGSSGGMIRFVDRTAAFGGNGGSWNRAFTDLQAALAVARAGDRIWVAQGIYTPGPAGGSRELTFALPDGVRVYGGFAGGETSVDQRDLSAHATVLSGDLAGDDGPDFAGAAENAYQVVTALHVGPSTLLDGFTIRGGHADGPGLGAVPESRDQGSGSTSTSPRRASRTACSTATGTRTTAR